jgi:hypothetical protein
MEIVNHYFVMSSMADDTGARDAVRLSLRRAMGETGNGRNAVPAVRLDPVLGVRIAKGDDDTIVPGSACVAGVWIVADDATGLLGGVSITSFVRLSVNSFKTIERRPEGVAATWIIGCDLDLAGGNGGFRRPHISRVASMRLGLDTALIAVSSSSCNCSRRIGAAEKDTSTCRRCC